MKSKYWLVINYNYDEDANNDLLEVVNNYKLVEA